MANGSNDSTWEYYRYDPSLAAAAIFVVLFFLTSATHAYQLFRKKSYFLIPFLIGGIFEIIGYIGRALSSRESPDWTMGPYIIQSLFILLAPALLAASIYMELGRIILLVDGEHLSLIRTRWLTKIFVAGDIISFLTQGAGGGIMASGKTVSSLKQGEHIIIGGLCIQLVFFGLFIVVSFVFQHRITRQPTASSKSPRILWKRHQYVLYFTSVLVFIRSLFRVIEYAQGNSGYLLSHEEFIYVFDALLMFIAMVALNVVHPGEIRKLLDEKSDEQSQVFEALSWRGSGVEGSGNTPV